MAKVEQVLQLDPPFELKFRGPFHDVVASKLNLTNPTDKTVCFKVKTTAPRRYCVRPNSGVLKPQTKVSVMLMLQPFEFDPHEKNKHKFMVQTMFMPDGDVNLETLFREADPGQLMDSKLRCVFEMPPDSNASATGAAPTAATTDDITSLNSTNSSTATHTDASGSQAKSQGHVDSELLKAAEEIKRLRTESSSLRQENLKLKEDKLQLSNKGGMSGPSVVSLHHQDDSSNSLTVHLTLSFVMLLIGFILAKWIL
uniref:Vesicle-associated membrane protein-associated protein A-like n=1 Tax=Hirondellea gigas TaxID=1518452 RepID=A0A2P2HX37_9CRUS